MKLDFIAMSYLLENKNKTFHEGLVPKFPAERTDNGGMGNDVIRIHKLLAAFFFFFSSAYFYLFTSNFFKNVLRFVFYKLNFLSNVEFKKLIKKLLSRFKKKKKRNVILLFV